MTMSEPMAGGVMPMAPGQGDTATAVAPDPGLYSPTAGAAPVPAVPTPAPPADAGFSREELSRSLEMLGDVEMSVTVELGRTRLPVRQLLALSPGSVIELNRAANTPVDVLVNDTLFARGEVVVIDDEFGVRITELVRREPGPGRG